jgi:hypothetical protein
MKAATLSTWRGHAQWRCAFCGHTTLNRDEIDRHLTGHHKIRAAYTIPEVEPDETETPAPADDEPKTKPEKASAKKQADAPEKDS